MSYARADRTFADRLADALGSHGFRVLIDRRDLPLLEEWQNQLIELIAASDSVVFILSPRSVVSHWCNWELEQVARFRKRLAPVLLEDVSTSEVPASIKKLNYAPFTGDADFKTELERLVAALKTDFPWVQESSRLGNIARRWSERGRPAALLLRGSELEDAERWAARRPPEAPEVSPEQHAWLEASRIAVRTRARRIVIGLSVGVVLALGLAGWALVNRRVAMKERDNAQEQERRATAGRIAVTAAAEGARQPRFLQRSALLSLESLRIRPTLEADATLRQALELLPKGRILGQHRGDIWSLTFSANGKWLASPSDDHDVGIWSMSGTEVVRLPHDAQVDDSRFTANGELLVTLEGRSNLNVWDWKSKVRLWRHLGPAPTLPNEPAAGSLMLGPDDSVFLSEYGAKVVRQFDIRDGHELHRFPGTGFVHLTSDGKELVLVNDQEVAIWKVQSGNLDRVFPLGVDVSDSALSMGGLLALSIDPDRKKAHLAPEVLVINVRTGRRQHLWQSTSTDSVTPMVFSHNDEWLAISVVNDPNVYVVNTQTGQPISTLKHEQSPFEVAFSPNDQWLATTNGSDGIAQVWDVRNGRELSRMTHEGDARRLGFSPDGRQIATTDYVGESRVHVRLWDALPTRSFSLAVAGEPGTISFDSSLKRVAISASSHTAYGDDSATVSDMFSRRVIKQIAGVGQAMFLRGDDRLLAVQSGAIKLLDTESDRAQPPAQTIPESTNRIAVDTKGYNFAVANENGVQVGHELPVVWETRKQLPSAVWALAFSPDDFALAIGFGRTITKELTTVREVGADGLWLWDFQANRVLKSFDIGETVSSVAFSPKRELMAAAGWSDSNLRVWSTTDWREVRRLEKSDHVTCLAFSSDGKWLAAGSSERLVHVWSTSSYQEVARLRQGAEISALSFSRDDRWLASGDRSGAVHFWSWPPAMLAVDACDSISSNLSETEWQQFVSDGPRRKTCPQLP